jgi:hypothetical protein
MKRHRLFRAVSRVIGAFAKWHFLPFLAAATSDNN